ncbi:MAG TPA: hypothetical protein PL029_00225 [Bacteroidia bacterium]|nr:hypothetical protein [Bacteroidia bacterium]
MPSIKHIVLFAILLIGGMAHGTNLFPARPAKSGKGIRISAGPVIGFYSINRNHAKGLFPRPGGMFSYKKEIRFGHDYRTSFLFGFDYFIHGFTFLSYYFTQDTLQLYDKKFNYKYSVLLQEINLPFNVKYSFNRENNSQFTQYFMIGYHLRYLLPADLKVTQNGNTVITDNPQMKFKNHLISEQINAYLSASFGWQKNNTSSAKAGFFIELNYRYGFSPYYFETKYSARALFVNSSHLSLQLGVKF